MAESLYEILHVAARRGPTQAAVDFAGERISYADLLDRVDRLAALFASSGIGPGRFVALAFRKSIDAVAVLYALNRVGATYVPIDPTWPAERIDAICDDADIRFWTGTSPPPVGISTLDATFVARDGGDRTLPLVSAAAMPPMTRPAVRPVDDIANLLYTSGSTGRPKGVRITTRSLLHFSQWAVDTFAINDTDRVANHAPLHFDLSTLDLFAAARAGATLCPVPERIKPFPVEMARFIAGQEITVWYSVPSALVLMQQRARLIEFDMSALRLVLFAGEVMPRAAMNELIHVLPCAEFANLYGPTETNVCTCQRLGPVDFVSPGPIPIGMPIADTRVWLVDERGSVAPNATTGELWVAGPTVAAGYQSDPLLTADRFVPAPDGDGIAYRTGDRVTRAADGTLYFDGRIDRQIKCRGYRIEPGDIEAALAAHPNVKEAAVVPLEDPRFGQRIKACVVAREGRTLSEADLAAHCRERLPAYMLPDVWQFRDALPRNDREKVDLQALVQ